MTTPVISIPEMASDQNQKYLTFNSAMRRLDGLVNLTIFNRTTTTPPGSPSEGDRYIVGGSATGAWASQDDKVAIYIGSAWEFVTPSEGWLAYDQTENEIIIYDGAAWAAFVASSSVSSDTNGSSHQFFTVEEELTGLSGASVSSTLTFPNQCIIYGVSSRVTTTITGATSFDVGDGTTANRFGGTLGLSAGSTNQGTIGPAGNYSTPNVVLTANGSNFTGGAVRISAHYSVLNAPTS